MVRMCLRRRVVCARGCRVCAWMRAWVGEEACVCLYACVMGKLKSGKGLTLHESVPLMM